MVRGPEGSSSDAGVDARTCRESPRNLIAAARVRVAELEERVATLGAELDALYAGLADRRTER